MSNADWDVAYCERCQECHLNGICPKERLKRPYVDAEPIRDKPWKKDGQQAQRQGPSDQRGEEGR